VAEHAEAAIRDLVGLDVDALTAAYVFYLFGPDAGFIRVSGRISWLVAVRCVSDWPRRE